MGTRIRSIMGDLRASSEIPVAGGTVGRFGTDGDSPRTAFRHRPYGPRMDRVVVAGIVCTAVGLGGYAVGTAVAYPGRSLSVTLTMIGVALLAVGVPLE